MHFPIFRILARTAARAKSAPAARVDRGGIDTTLRDRRLANYEAKLKQEEPVSPAQTAVIGASAPRGAEHYQMVYPGTGSASDPLRIGETASPWTRHQERAHRLSARPEQPSAGGYYPSEGIPRVSTRSVPRYDETSDVVLSEQNVRQDLIPRVCHGLTPSTPLSTPPAAPAVCAVCPVHFIQFTQYFLPYLRCSNIVSGLKTSRVISVPISFKLTVHSKPGTMRS